MQLATYLSRPTFKNTAGLLFLLALAVLAERYLSPEYQSELSGHVRLIDGDSLEMSGHEVRLVGVDAPEGIQMCLKDGKPWRCGEVSTQALSRMIAGRSIRCSIEGRDQHRRLLGTCKVGGLNLNREMIRQGHAVAFGNRYMQDERDAKAAGRGMWSGTFERPQQWRRKHLGTVD